MEPMVMIGMEWYARTNSMEMTNTWYSIFA